MDLVEALANGDLCVALGYTGDMLQARDRARDAKNGIEIKYMIPREGSIMWFNMLAIPNHARNVDSALAFIDYMMVPKVIADISNAHSLCQCQRCSLRCEMILESIRL